MLTYTKNLNKLNRNSLSEAGGKGANLGELIGAGLPVPLGFVVTTVAYRSHLAESGLQERISDRIAGLKENDFTALTEASNDISAWIEAAPMPIQIQEDVSSAYESLSEKMGIAGPILVAVRSSATAEDLLEASFAGQHDTYLGIHGENDVLEYVKKCWASLWSSQAISYRISQGFKHLEVELAVVVQAMIDSESAGVMFTANPINGNNGEMLISAGFGLGEAVVSGLITPDTFILTKSGSVKSKTLGSKETQIILTENGTVTEDVPHSKRKTFCLGTNELMQLTNLAGAVEKYYGSSMDTEWALSKGKIYLLQARPITTMTSDPEDLNILGPEDKVIYQGKKPSFIVKIVMDMFSEPVVPLDFAYLDRRYQASMGMMKNMGMKLPKEPVMPVERESGCVAIRLKSPSISPAMLWKFPVFMLEGSSDDIKALWQPLSKEINTWLKNMELAGKNITDPVKAEKLLEQAMEEFGELFRKRFIVFFKSGIAADTKLSKMLKKIVGKEHAQEIKEKLFRALPFRTALQNKALIKVAQTAALNGKDSKIFKEELRKFIQEYGDRPALSAAPTLGTPTWREMPESIHQLIDTLLKDKTLLNSEESFKKQEADYESAKKEIQEKLKPSEYSKFQKTLERARDATIVREESSYLTEKLTACVRRMALKLGNILAENSLIDEADDIFFLFIEELGAVAGDKLAMKEKIKQRKVSYAKVYAAHKKGIHWMVSTGSLPVFETKKKTERHSDSFQGESASRGMYEGSVCVVNDPSEFNKLKKGNILVSTYTSPAWTPLFRVASAVVTERGSAGSHAAIVSREYGIPCVVAIPDITNVLKDGQIIRVDGTNGTVTILKGGYTNA